MNDNLRVIADNILTHLEATGTPRKAHGERLADVDLVADILLQSLTHQGYVRIASMSGQALRPDAFNQTTSERPLPPAVQNPGGVLGEGAPSGVFTLSMQTRDIVVNGEAFVVESALNVAAAWADLSEKLEALGIRVTRLEAP